ncbi:uncharacterized protein LOC124476797 isoform X2 [Hypomesus transpacificus]|uniref:uncharacterized protein LOC124476797 isoform X2 n=1 Tax=Hypomesus transpacificus TaxID=137520 RepID=UPI001F0724E6|nr:uncharacterized protein LOC124476797 isoform X2 [Hypomesus transpacificus]
MYALFTLINALSTLIASVETSSVIYSEVGENVFIPCPCDRTCHSILLNWLRIQQNGSLEIINTNGERFLTNGLTNGLTGLQILHVDKSDSGRYYCGEQLTYQGFHGDGVILHIEEASSMANHNKISPKAILLTEDQSDEQEIHDLDDDIGERRHRLRCVVNGLSTPGVTITFLSSRGEKSEGQTWASLMKNNQYSVLSAYTVRSVWYSGRHEVLEYHKQYGREETEYDRDVTAWWCEVQTGKNRTLKSNKTVIFQQSHPDVCLPLLYSAVAVAGLCVVFIIIITAHAVWSMRKGMAVPQDQCSPMRDLQTDVIYSSVMFNQSAGPGRRQRDKPVINPEDDQQYPILKYSRE